MFMSPSHRRHFTASPITSKRTAPGDSGDSRRGGEDFQTYRPIARLVMSSSQFPGRSTHSV
jgi:hypothetical protein